jgi:uncharacterized protein YjbI with pentapeptide repeats
MYKAWVKNADCSGANFQNIKGSQSQWQNSNLKGAKLEGADLSGARCEGTNFENAGLQTANLNRSVLKDANFKGADLRGANLRYVVGLTREQIEMAQINSKTLFPSYFKIKWTSETIFELFENKI